MMRKGVFNNTDDDKSTEQSAARQNGTCEEYSTSFDNPSNSPKAAGVSEEKTTTPNISEPVEGVARVPVSQRAKSLSPSVSKKTRPSGNKVQRTACTVAANCWNIHLFLTWVQAL